MCILPKVLPTREVQPAPDLQQQHPYHHGPYHHLQDNGQDNRDYNNADSFTFHGFSFSIKRVLSMDIKNYANNFTLTDGSV